MSLPANFLNGFASAAFQVEGAAKEGGRGRSIWDTFCATPGRIADGSNGDVSCDSYHKWKQDISLLKQYGKRCLPNCLSEVADGKALGRTASRCLGRGLFLLVERVILLILRVFSFITLL